MTKLLVIDDDPPILEMISMAFPDYDVTTCQCAEDGITAFLKATPDVVLCDIQLPDMTGMEVFEKMHRMNAKVPVILMTGRGTAGTAIEAIQRGAFEYILKPLDPDTLQPLIEEAAETSRMTRTPAVLPGVVPGDPSLDQPHDDGSDMLIGSCRAMQEVYRSIGRVARQNVTALILGESGTGKEVIARAIYQYSERSSHRFLAINCAAIPEQLLESELFGHEKGSFTGADRKKVGKFELCNDGTLFLDEIGDMTPLMQTKILRALQDQTFERVGGSDTIHTNARLIAATNRDLEAAIKDKSFRSDLFYRLNVYTIKLPPLRERGDDIALLANYFLRRFAKELGREITGFAPEAMKLVVQYHWPGNVRELQSAVKHAILEATGPVIVPAFLPSSVRDSYASTSHEVTSLEVSSQSKTSGKHDHDSNGKVSRELAAETTTETASAAIDFAALTRERLQSDSDDIHRELISMAEREVFTEVLKHTDGNLTQAAQRLGITRTTLRTRLEGLGMSVDRNPTITPN